MHILLGMGESIGLAGVAVMLWTLGALSRRLGEVLKMRPHYRLAQAGAALVLLAALTNLLSLAAATGEPASLPQWLSAPGFALWLYYLPLNLGLLAGVWVAARYWGWLLTHRQG
ncbi:MAG: hypothetical protein HY784_09790 [Chloroflexi bacterium]|nr:hypothetical protein [Chloroflexota bacterium]